MDPGTLAVFLIAVAICFISAVARDRLHRLPFAEEAVIAGHLIHGDGFLSPYDASPGAPPSCYCAPIYPSIIAVTYDLIGSRHAILALLAVNSLSFGVIVAGLFQLARLYVSTLAGWTCAVALVLHPVLLYFVTDWWDSYVALALFVGVLVAAARGPGRRIWLFSAAVGACMGMLSLTNASYLLAYPLVILIALRGCSWRRKWKGIACCIGCFAIVLSPWTIRNAVVFDRFIPVRGGTDYYLWLGNQPGSIGWLDDQTVRSGPAFDESERELILKLGEPAYFDLCGPRFRHEIDDAPGQFWLRSARRLLFVFMSDPTKAYLPFPLMHDVKYGQIYVDRALLHGIVAMLGVAGVWAAWRLKLKCVWIFAAALLAELPFVFTFGSDRYNLPMRVVLVFFTAILVGVTARRIRRGTLRNDTGVWIKSSSPI